MKRTTLWQEALTFFGRGKIIENQVRKNKSTIYGSQAIKIQIGGGLSRIPGDYDILSKNSKKSAHQLQATLDKKAGGNYYYATPSKVHKGTHKVYHVGKDKRRGTKDDIGIADFSIPERKQRTVKVNGIKYVHLNEIIKDKKKSLRDPMFEFRHAKDYEDKKRIENARTL